MAKPLSKIDGIPAIFNFHVDEYKNVETPADIEEFEMLMKNAAQVREFDFSKENILRSGTTSCSGGRADDCDQIMK